MPEFKTAEQFQSHQKSKLSKLILPVKGPIEVSVSPLLIVGIRDFTVNIFPPKRTLPGSDAPLPHTNAVRISKDTLDVVDKKGHHISLESEELGRYFTAIKDVYFGGLLRLGIPVNREESTAFFPIAGTASKVPEIAIVKGLMRGLSEDIKERPEKYSPVQLRSRAHFHGE